MGMETKYICDGCGKEGLSQREFNTVVLFCQSYKYAGWSIPDACLCERCTDEFIEKYGLAREISQDSTFFDIVQEKDKPEAEIFDYNEDAGQTEDIPEDGSEGFYE